MPGTAVFVGVNSPRTLSGASGFMSQRSIWLGPPKRNRNTQEFARGLPAGAEARRRDNAPEVRLSAVSPPAVRNSRRFGVCRENMQASRPDESRGVLLWGSWSSAFTSPLEGEVAASPWTRRVGGKRHSFAEPFPPPARCARHLPLKGGGQEKSSPTARTRSNCCDPTRSVKATASVHRRTRRESPLPPAGPTGSPVPSRPLSVPPSRRVAGRGGN